MAQLKIPVTEKDHIRGNFDAPVTLLEYGDFECSYCAMAYPIIKRVEKYFGDQLRFVFRHFPLTEVHSNAEMAAETSEFTAEHHHFWQAHDLIYENQHMLGMTFLVNLMEKLGLNVQDLQSGLENRTYQPLVRGDFLGGVRSGVNGTPTFFINGYRHVGPFSFETLVTAIKTVT